MAVSSVGNSATTQIMGFFNSPSMASSLSDPSQSAGIQEELVRRAFEVEGRLCAISVLAHIFAYSLTSFLKYRSHSNCLSGGR